MYLIGCYYPVIVDPRVPSRVNSTGSHFQEGTKDLPDSNNSSLRIVSPEILGFPRSETIIRKGMLLSVFFHIFLKVSSLVTSVLWLKKEELPEKTLGTKALSDVM